MNRKRSIGIIVLVVLLATAAALWADNRLVWTPGALTATAVNGMSTTTQVSFISDKPLLSAKVVLSNGLKDYVSVSPASFAKVAKDQKVTLTLTLSSSANTPPHTVAGTIAIYKDGGATLAPDTLPVALSIEPVVLPPDPGEAGKATLEGIDSDRDGIRDDIQRYIALTYWNKPVLVAGLRQYARPLQQEVLHFDNEAGALADTGVEDTAFSCMEYRTGDLLQADQISDELIAQLLNTDARSKAYLKFNQLLGGHVFPGRPLPTANLCTEPIQ